MYEKVMFLLPRIFCFFFGLEGPVLSSLTENGPKRGPNCAADVPVQGAARARASYRSIISTIGNPFWFNWDQEGSKPKKSHQSTKAAGPDPAARPKILRTLEGRDLGGRRGGWRENDKRFG